MTAHHQNSRLTIQLPAVDHKRLKAIAALRGVSLKDLLLKCIRENLLNYIDDDAFNKELHKSLKRNSTMLSNLASR